MKRYFTLVPLTLIIVLLVSAQVQLVSMADAHSPQSIDTPAVNTTADTDDGMCDAVNCSLREAINLTNADPNVDYDTITFSVSGTITLGSMLPFIFNDATIDGSGQSITISGGDTTQIMRLQRGTTLNLNALTIVSSKGNSISNNGGTLNVTNSTFSGNSGGILNHGEFDGSLIYKATLNVSNSTFSLNTSSSIYNDNVQGTAIVSVTGSTFTYNSGDGIEDRHGNLTISDSTFSNNTGTGIDTTGTANVNNSTFLSNTRDGIESKDKLTVTNSTFAGNHRGIFIWSGTANLTNVTFSGNAGGVKCTPKAGQTG